MDLYDLVPKNHAERLAELLEQSSDEKGSVSAAAQRSLDPILERRGVPADKRILLLAHKGLSAQDYLFRAIELVLDLSYPSIQGSSNGGLGTEEMTQK
jgi:hypothetical protein